MVCELVPAGRGPAPAEPLVPVGTARRGELRQGGARADLRRSPEDGVRRHAVRLLLHEPADGDQRHDRRQDADRQAGGLRQRHAGAGRSAPAGDEDQEAVLAHGADERLRAGRRDLDARGRGREEDRRSAVARRHDAHRRRDRTARLPLARRSAGDAALGRSARRRRSQEQGAVPRQGRLARGAVLRRSRSRSRRRSGATAASTTPTPASRC